MKKTIFLIVLFYTISFGQGWNNTVTTTISESNLDKMDLFTNKDGNHLLVKRSNGNIIYYNFNSSGTVDGSKTETLVTNGDFPNIVGSNDKLFALYKDGNYIKGKYSTNGGDSWTSLPYNNSIGSNDCNGIDAVYDDAGVHVVWATKDSSPEYETYYKKLRTDNYNWVEGKNVTDVTNYQYGSYPTVAVSTDRIHVSFNTGNGSIPGNQGDAKSRDKYNSTWQTPQTISSGSGNLSSAEKIQVAGSTLFDFYFLFVEGMGQYHNDLYVKTRGTSGTT